MNRQHTQSQPNLCAREEIAQHKRLMRIERRSDLDLLRFEKPKKVAIPIDQQHSRDRGLRWGTLCSIRSHTTSARHLRRSEQ